MEILNTSQVVYVLLCLLSHPVVLFVFTLYLSRVAPKDLCVIKDPSQGRVVHGKRKNKTFYGYLGRCVKGKIHSVEVNQRHWTLVFKRPNPYQVGFTDLPGSVVGKGVNLRYLKVQSYQGTGVECGWLRLSGSHSQVLWCKTLFKNPTRQPNGPKFNHLLYH